MDLKIHAQPFEKHWGKILIFKKGKEFLKMQFFLILILIFF